MTVDNRTTSTDSRTGSRSEAEHWFVRLLEPDCTDAERQRFEHWRSADPAHATAYRAVEQLWTQSRAVAHDPAIMAAANRALHWTRPEPWFRRRWFVPATASAFALIAMLAFLPRWLAAPADPPGTHYTTITGQQRTVALPDGSSMLLDTATEVVERYSKGTRRMDLLGGRAQFSVQGNPQRPFVVHAPGGTVTAVGTRFQVKIDNDGTNVVLLKGKLAIATETTDGTRHTAALTTGEQLAFHQDGRLDPVHAADREAAQGWTTGKLFVRDWRLPDLLAEMNRYSENQLQIGDTSLENIRISGVFRSGDQESLIQTLQQGWPIQVKRVSPRKTLLLRSK